MSHQLSGPPGDRAQHSKSVENNIRLLRAQNYQSTAEWGALGQAWTLSCVSQRRALGHSELLTLCHTPSPAFSGSPQSGSCQFRGDSLRDLRLSFIPGFGFLFVSLGPSSKVEKGYLVDIKGSEQ